VSSTYGLFHIFIGSLAVSKVYGLIYKAVPNENTNGMQLYECFLVAFMLIIDDCTLMVNAKKCDGSLARRRCHAVFICRIDNIDSVLTMRSSLMLSFILCRPRRCFRGIYLLSLFRQMIADRNSKLTSKHKDHL
jgi:hypothetical protein